MPVYKDAKGSWFYKCCINGKQYLKRGFPTKSEASKAEVIFKAENQSKSINLKSIKFYELVEAYLNHRKMNVKPTTHYFNKLKIKNYILANFENVEVNKLTWKDFLNFRSKLCRSSLKDKNEVLRHLIHIFDYLDLFFEINIPYARRLPKFKNYAPKSINKTINENVEKDLFFKYYKHSNQYLRMYLLTTYIFGLRISEARGLVIDAFDLKNRLLYILQASTNKTGEGKSVDLSPKSNSSVRKYYLSHIYIDIFIRFIHDHKLKGKDRLFYSKNNKKIALSENSLRGQLCNISKMYNLKHITPHGLRHGIASYLYAEGISETEIGKYLGHKYNNVTMDTYIELTKERQQQIIDKITEFIIELNVYCED